MQHSGFRYLTEASNKWHITNIKEVASTKLTNITIAAEMFGKLNSIAA